MRVALTMVMLMTFAVEATAQDDVEYRMEIGAGVGTAAYYGDFNDALFKGMQPLGAVVFRAILNPRMAVNVSAMLTQAKGDVNGVSTVYPDMVENGYSFANTLGDLSVSYEYNFFPYGTGHEYRGAKRLTPFISLGLGITYVKSSEGTWDYSAAVPYSQSKSIVAANFPLGIGVKYKVASRLNLSLDWRIHFSSSDYIDGVKDPYRISSSGMFKNTDCYSALTLALTYSFSPKCPTCQKDR